MIMEDTSQEQNEHQGATTIAPGVLVTIAQLTALGVPGVVRLTAPPVGINRWFRRTTGDGVIVGIDGDTVSVELHLILTHDVNVRQVSRKVQQEVARAIEEMVGMKVNSIDVHIEDIDFEDPDPVMDES
jgi:uncharacterized alkaline shock family protein YloU